MSKRSSTKKPAHSAEQVSKSGPDLNTPEGRAERFRVEAGRETIEAFVVAFILALLFRAFLAEAFVIPTGSMAPTLMGAHKDVHCERCDTRFQVGASRERNGVEMTQVVVGGVCPNCRYANVFDLKDESNHTTFNGDRILVSKFAYTINDPKRWDVIVFKFPGNPKQNYIKRLVGLPNETITLRHGDVYAAPTGSDQPPEILRKPPETLLAMRHLVYDTDQQSEALIKSGYPSRWQPWRENASEPPKDSWEIDRSTSGLTAQIENADPSRFQWMRYYHRWPDDNQWKIALEGGSLSDVDPYRSRAITDFYAYDSYIHVQAGYVYEQAPRSDGATALERMLNGGYSQGRFRPRYRSGGELRQFGGAPEWGGQDSGRQELGRDGLHWVGDLMVEADVETDAAAKELLLELVEAGVKYRCRIDLGSGKASLSIDDVNDPRFDGDGTDSETLPTAATSIRAGGRYQLRFSNCDDQLLLWVDDEVIPFDRPTTFDARDFRSDSENHPQYLASHPLDAAPAGLAIRGGGATVRSLRIDRDKYYIATQNSNFGILEYDLNELWSIAGDRVSPKAIQQVYGMPERWSDFVGWDTRRVVSFELHQEQYFPMGDNSPESLDARCWAGSKAQIRLPRGVNEDAWRWSDDYYVPRDLLVGKALVVFWPHSWNSPVPFTPNFSRMKLIR